MGIKEVQGVPSAERLNDKHAFLAVHENPHGNLPVISVQFFQGGSQVQGISGELGAEVIGVVLAFPADSQLNQGRCDGCEDNHDQRREGIAPPADCHCC